MSETEHTSAEVTAGGSSRSNFPRAEEGWPSASRRGAGVPSSGGENRPKIRRASRGEQLAGWAVVPLIGLTLFLLALAPRLAALDAYVTIDESRWVQRASDFYALLAQRDAEDTFIIGHPGVTTMWTALAGMGPERALRFSFREGRTDVTRREGYWDALMAARRPFAALAAVGVAAVGLLGWRLLGPGPGLAGGALLALEPFLAAHAGVVHLDSALTAYTAVCLLAALVWWQGGGGLGYLLLSGVAGGLAFLTKAPSVFVLGFVPLIVAIDLGRGRAGGWPESRTWWRVALLLGLWGLVTFGISVALWPALRANPVRTLLEMVQFTERVGGGEHDNFFMGQVREDPGPFFYPLALLFRLSPLGLVGLILAIGCWSMLASSQRRTVLTLGAYCLGFGLMMSLAPKKFDRYLLPLFPILGLIAGLGLWTAARRVLAVLSPARRPLAKQPSPQPSLRGRAGQSPLSLSERAGVTASRRAANLHWTTAVVAISLLLLQAAPLLAAYPYYLAYYNPLLGGGAVARGAILVGWGEGLDQVATYLNALPRHLGAPTVATSYHRVLQAQLDGSAVPLERVRMADYVVPYVNTLQRDAERDVLAPYLEGGPPEYTVQIGGIEYARVYRGPHYPLGGPVGAEYGRLTLTDFVLAPGSARVRAGDEIQLLLRWDGAPTGDDQAQVVLLDRDGRQVARDERPVGADGPDPSGRSGEVHRLTVPPRTALGEYAVAVRVSDGRAPAALPVVASAQAGTDTVTLATVTVEAGS